MKISCYEGRLTAILKTIATLTVFVLGFTSSAAAQATATIAGAVRDAQGGIMPGAAITLISETRGTTFEAVSGSSGDFVITNLPGDTYAIRVTMRGFKTTERNGVQASPGDRVAVGSMILEVGDIAERVEVSAQAPLIQTQTGEASSVVSQKAVQNVPVSGTFFAQLVALTPGVYSTSSNAPARLDNNGN